MQPMAPEGGCADSARVRDIPNESENREEMKPFLMKSVHGVPIQPLSTQGHRVCCPKGA